MNPDPDQLQHAKLRFDAATAFSEKGQHEEAAAAYLDVLKTVPDLVPAHFNLGNAYFAMRRFDDAAAAFQRVVGLDPDAATFNNLGNALASAGDFEAAEKAFRDALRCDPTCVPAINNLGPVLAQLGQHEEALDWLLRAVELTPDHPRTHAMLGDLFCQLGQIDNALNCYEQSLKLNPRQTDRWLNLGACQSAMGRLYDAAASYVQAQQFSPDDARVYNNLGEVNRSRGQLTEAQFCYLRALQLSPALHETHSNWLLTMLYDPAISGARLFEEAKIWARQHAARPDRLPAPTNDPTPHRPLRIGYLSADLRQHPVGYLVEPVLRHHDRTRVEVYCYYNRTSGDCLTDTLRAHADQWRSVADCTDDELARTIRDDEIDILVELAGHTADHRLLVMARKPAPIQASWLGFWGTTGIQEIDYVVADEVVIPEAEQSQFTEKIVRLPECYACFAAPAESLDVTPLPSASSEVFTFGCLNNLAKITPAVIRQWATALLAVSNSRLFLKTPALADERVRERICADFGANFIGAERLRLEGGGPRKEMLAAYSEIDVALDPFPFNGGLTSLEALWMGVPVLTLRGERFASHATASYLRALGLEEWIADSKEDYTAKALHWSADSESLTRLRKSLRQRMKDSPLCDQQGFTQQLEAAYREMWQAWCDASD